MRKTLAFCTFLLCPSAALATTLDVFEIEYTLSSYFVVDPDFDPDFFGSVPDEFFGNSIDVLDSRWAEDITLGNSSGLPLAQTIETQLVFEGDVLVQCSFNMVSERGLGLGCPDSLPGLTKTIDRPDPDSFQIVAYFSGSFGNMWTEASITHSNDSIIPISYKGVSGTIMFGETIVWEATQVSTYTISAVPGPATAGLLLTTAGAMCALRRRRGGVGHPQRT